MEKDFDEFWNECLRTAHDAKCPIPDVRLEQMITYAIKQTPHPSADSTATPKHTPILWRRPWFRAAAAVLLLVLVPLTLMHSHGINATTIAYGGQSLHFRSNTDCNPAQVVDLVSKYIDPQPAQPAQSQALAFLGPAASRHNNLISFR